MNYEEQRQWAVKAAKEEGFTHAVWMRAADLKFDHALRRFCEQNVCGNFGKNYACPPDCGTPEEMEAWTQGYEDVLVLQTVNPVEDWSDPEQVKSVKTRHNRISRNLIERMETEGLGGLSMLAGPCTYCSPCAIVEGAPCRFPGKRSSCLSAYCVVAEDLMKTCGLSYWCGKNVIGYISLYLTKKEKQ